MNATSIITVTLGIIVGSAIGVAGFSGAIDLPMLSASQSESDSSAEEGADCETEAPEAVDDESATRNKIFDKVESYLSKNPHDRRRALIYGATLVEECEFERAEEFYLGLVENNPKDSEIVYSLGWMYEQSKQWAKAVEAYEAACELKIQNVTASNNLAWVLATAPDDSVRDGKRAVKFAKRAMQMAPSHPAIADTLAAAYAETGDFVNAIKYQRIVIKGSPTMEIQGRLKLYEQGKPFRAE